MPANSERPLTTQRRLVLEILHEAGTHLDAVEIYRRAGGRNRRISLATIYRNLHLFKEMGIVDEIRLDDVHCYYEIKRPGRHCHLVCHLCGQVFELETPLITELTREVEDRGFAVKRAVLHFEGCCGTCSDAKGSD